MKVSKIVKLKILVGVAILVMAPLMMNLVSYLSNQQTTCLFDAMGFRCLGCNILGALYQLGQGNLVGAFNQNPLIYMWIGLGGIILLSELYTIGKRLIDKTYRRDSVLEWLLKKMFKGIVL